MIVLNKLFIFYLGSIFGSFLYCCTNRYIDKHSLMERSRCDNCKHILSVFDLIPIFSFIILKGKCRYCNKNIDYKCLIYEIITGVCFSCFYYNINLLFLSILSIVISIYDDRKLIIPDILIIIGIINSHNTFLLEINNSLLISIFLLILLLIMNKVFKKETMGIGDIKLIFMFNLYFGIYISINSLFYACLICLIILIIRKVNKTAFGPYICLGYLISYISLIIM